MSLQQKIKIKLRAFDHRLLEAAVRDIVGAVKRTGSTVKGPIPLPTHIRKFIVNRSPHVDKKSREQFEMRNRTRLMVISTTPQTIDALMKLDLASGVDVEVKLIDDAR
ncbi:30S ribosomal protein S10 [Rickettsiales endosymbiont of Peranema trichophorum]|uniref:30S ribosomal protein S10 n=1 Tax=Rickettsiales endosymbiont of Peranema trichophorum TaxID=2486577 RepID=UPI001022AF3D|nr:30S ribosomal protein S10 [Rickettsiales endosymbiont of Peranema trichophorum]RZI45558.1 30S ribosomal protein S10 [Rickettsiales endosymbiont of Peranema trichophorum]